MLQRYLYNKLYVAVTISKIFLHYIIILYIIATQVE